MEQHETGIVVILLERKRGKNSNPKKPLLTACLHPATKGKPEISEQVLIKAVSSESNRQYWGHRLPGLKAAWLGPCSWRWKTPLFLRNRSGRGTAAPYCRWTWALTADGGRSCELCCDSDFKKPVLCSRSGANDLLFVKKKPTNPQPSCAQFQCVFSTSVSSPM